TVRITHDQRVAAFELPCDAQHPRRQQALAAAQRVRGARVDVNLAGGLEGAGDPLLAHRGGSRRGIEPAAALAALDGLHGALATPERDAHMTSSAPRDL